MRARRATIGLVFCLAIACQRSDSAPSENAKIQPGGPTIEDSLRTIEQEWADAIRTRDSTTLERLVAPDYALTAQGTTDPPVPRDVWMTNTLKNLQVDSIRLSRAEVVVKGDTATTTLKFFWAGRFKTMPAFRDSTSLKDIWVRSPGGWQVHRRILAD